MHKHKSLIVIGIIMLALYVLFVPIASAEMEYAEAPTMPVIVFDLTDNAIVEIESINVLGMYADADSHFIIEGIGTGAEEIYVLRGKKKAHSVNTETHLSTVTGMEVIADVEFVFIGEIR